MRALIIAAGAGTRFGKITQDVPKPLVEIQGKPLIKWVMDSLVKGGVDDVTIVVGYLGERIMESIGREHSGIPIDYILNENWSNGNLTSLYSARDHFDGDFILSMSDHLFDPTVVRDVIRIKSDHTVMLAVDRKYQQVEDDMKVLAINGRIRNIGKDIVGNYVDTGLFKMKSKIFEYAEAVIKRGEYHLFLAIKEAALKNDAIIYDIGRRFWIDVDTPEELKSYYVQNFPKYIKTGKWD